MVWIIPKDTNDNMMRQLIYLMTNMETNRYVFELNGDLSNRTDAFNVFENDYFKDEYRFVKGYLQFTGIQLTSNRIMEQMNLMDQYMRNDISLDINYCFPTAHYTVARKSINKYNRLIQYANHKLKQIKYKYHFVWINDGFSMSNFDELKYNTSKFPETFEIMRNLSTIIIDNGGIFSIDNNGNSLVSGKPIYQVNYPEIIQLKGGDKIVNLPITIHTNYSTRMNIAEKFVPLIPDTKKFANSRVLFKGRQYYTEGLSNKIVEKKEIKDLKLPEIDRVEYFVTKITKLNAQFNVVSAPVDENNKKQIASHLILKYLSCHSCFTPLYDDFYYIIIKKADIPICPFCYHSELVEIPNHVTIGISRSPFTAYDILSLVSKPKNMTFDNYEKYKKLINDLLYHTIEVKLDESIIYKTSDYIIVNNLNTDLLHNNDTSIFIANLS